MKLKFKKQDFQPDAVNTVADLFAGQDKMRSAFENNAICTVWIGETVFHRFRTEN